MSKKESNYNVMIRRYTDYELHLIQSYELIHQTRD